MQSGVFGDLRPIVRQLVFAAWLGVNRSGVTPAGAGLLS